MKGMSIITALAAGILSLSYYILINYLYFHDFGFVETGRIVFATFYGYFDYLILPLSVLSGMVFYKRQHINANSKALFEFGLKTSLLAAFLFSLFIFGALQFSSTDYFKELINLIKEMNAPAKQPGPFVKSLLVNIAPIEKTKLFQSPLFYAIANFIVYFLLASLSARLFVIWTKKKASISVADKRL